MKRALLAGCVLVLSAAAFVPVRAVFADGDDHPLYPFDTYRPSASDNAALQWNDEALECIRATRPGPTVVARTLFILSAASYDAWASYDAKAVPTVRTGFTRRPATQRTPASKSAAVSYAAHRALSYLAGNNPFQPCRADFDARLGDLGLSVAEATAANPATTAGKDGKRAADNIIAARRNDGANQAGNYADTTGYRPVNTPDRVSTRGGGSRCGCRSATRAVRRRRRRRRSGARSKPFDPNLPGAAIQVPNPFQLSTAEKSAMIDEIVRESAQLDDRKKVVAEYWADGPQSELPPGHWNLIAGWVSRRWQQSIDADAKMFLALNGAMLDASIAAWQHKYRYDFARPVSAIRTLRAGQMIRAWAGPGRGTELIRGEDWLPYQAPTFPTPPFPAYTSGHSTFSAAGAAVMKDFGAIMGRDGDIFGATVTVRAGDSRFEQGITPRPGTSRCPGRTSPPPPTRPACPGATAASTGRSTTPRPATSARSAASPASRRPRSSGRAARRRGRGVEVDIAAAKRVYSAQQWVYVRAVFPRRQDDQPGRTRTSALGRPLSHQWP